MRFPMIARKWRWPKVLYGLMALELLVDIAVLTLFGIADPDTYRTKLWQNGYDEGFNSSPNAKVYAFANYRPYETPLVWSQFITRFNVIISVLAIFLLLVKLILYVMRGFIPLVSLILHSTLIALFAVSIHAQSAPDMSDEENPSPGLPWYLSKGCSYAADNNRSYCQQARGAFGMSCVAVALYAAYTLLSLHSLLPTASERQSRQTDIEMSKISPYSPETSYTSASTPPAHDQNNKNNNKNYNYYEESEPEESREQRWQRNRQLFLNLPKSPVTPAGFARNPMTPRTKAFELLSGGNQGEGFVRQQQQQVGMEGPLPSLAGPGGRLPLRGYEGDGGRLG